MAVRIPCERLYYLVVVVVVVVVVIIVVVIIVVVIIVVVVIVIVVIVIVIVGRVGKLIGRFMNGLVGNVGWFTNNKVNRWVNR